MIAMTNINEGKCEMPIINEAAPLKMKSTGNPEFSRQDKPTVIAGTNGKEGSGLHTLSMLKPSG